eukprot:GHRR01023572.1.p1 GENE.GHRR01023572.1~~GHRR01023572.1.p1  ORF type:complete len:348 (+),score=146.78 GHRR01023572.1:747-1790(+)
MLQGCEDGGLSVDSADEMQTVAAAAATDSSDSGNALDGEQQQEQQGLGHSTAASPAGDCAGHAEQLQQCINHQAMVAAKAAAPAAAGQQDTAAAGAPDHTSGSSSSKWESFLSHKLTDCEAAALRTGGHSWMDAAAALDSGSEADQGLWKRARWQVSGRTGLPAAPDRLAAYGVKERLIARWQEVQKADAERRASHASASTSKATTHSKQHQQQQQQGDFMTPQQRLLFALCDSYSDVFYAAKPYPGGPGWSADVADEAVDAIIVHVLNHCAKTADLIKRNNDRIKAADPGDVAPVPRDQGFTRAKALILLPMRNMAFNLVRRLVALAQKETRADSVHVSKIVTDWH